MGHAATTSAADREVVVALDVGGSGMKCALVRRDGTVTHTEHHLTGAAFVHSRTHGCRSVIGNWAAGRTPLDPMADLILAQRFAVTLATSRGLDPDAPRHLARSVVLA